MTKYSLEWIPWTLKAALGGERVYKKSFAAGMINMAMLQNGQRQGTRQYLFLDKGHLRLSVKFL